MTSSRSPVDADPTTKPDSPGSRDERSDSTSAQSLERRIVFETVGKRLFGRSTGLVSLGRFVVLGTIGRGGMGTVYKAYDESLDRSIAIKVLHTETSEEHALRLQREAQALAKLSHPNVVHVYEVGMVDGRRFIAMELVVGRTLRQWHEGEHDWRARVRKYIDVGAGLAAAHAAGLVHRDFKPDNCIVDDRGCPKVLDFGLVRDVGSAAESGPSSSARSDGDAFDTALTSTGTVMGTRGYMPPEQLEGLGTDQRSDQFAFCVSLHEALYGARPFAGTTRAALLHSMSTGNVQPAPKGSGVPEAVRRILLRGLAADPEQRWSSMDELLAALRRQVAPRTWRALATGLALGLTATGIGLASYAQVGFRCEGADAHLRGVWDDARRQEVERALLHTRVSYAADTWERVEQRLDDYAARWADKHTEVCEATSVRQEQSAATMDLRMECLARRRIALAQSVELLVEIDAEGVETATELLVGLPRLERCDEVEALRAELAPPEDQQLDARVRAERERLQQAATSLRAGQYERAWTTANDVVDRATALEYTPLMVEALFQRGRARDERGEYAEAASDLERSHLLAAQVGYHSLQAETAAWLVRVVGYRLARHDEGRWWGKTALALARGPYAEPAVEGYSLVNEGSVLREQGEPRQALERFREALGVFERTLGTDHPSTASAEHDIAAVLRTQGELDQALEHQQRALAILERVLGPGHPKVAMAVNGVGLVLKQQGKHDEALVVLERALAIQESALGPEHPDIAATLANIGNLHMQTDRRPEALRSYERALAIKEKALGAQHPEFATLLSNMGKMLAQRGEHQAAQSYLQRALAIRERALGPAHADTVTTLLDLGVVTSMFGDHAAALPHVARALELQEQGEGFGPLDLALTHNNLGAILDSLGRIEESRAHSLEALALREQALGPDHVELVRPLLGLARLDIGAGRFADAQKRAEHALAIAKSQPVAPEHVAWARFILAQALWSEPRQRERAATMAKDAYVAAEGKVVETSLAEMRRWLEARDLL
ncbi:serine/threonine-protein kinase [Paraliomyxa miuraensis]|uniref:serine/threonine-protein kinase n=1 Tax=Paraliomyxa miuraensis TaxID=376150 RepID=UPI00225776DA|nr:serine/threonine-protein kinase [Paraliomyxa miuraensis]MCX4243456.1 tetratricopeptide repeat-containing serine/threonine protein kinase [Paraliomyxa miuraensis]